ncbi:prolipoprotein diacylglyceryl transferase [Amnibacterium setariae]|uniref:Phosphatidylglycerol--prolipoprotein diacylglyceryl transferase n=1 Tax=Amnibacterium setariae TaxID=2306585 RepID=A0A3A1U0R7_9MICO|nr:prolipoprotein diacylglyceryl transferase [Amnibacterium setariae]RIX28525.1 prolipoprotein diacylglyceryl transferase [Amnibacterium setariae]
MPVPAAIPSPPTAWAELHLGPLTVHTYALCILAGIVAAILVTQQRLARRGVPRGIVLDVAIWVVPLGIFVARIYHVLTHTGDYFFAGADLWNVLAIWDGGNAIYGSMLGGALGIWIGCRRAGLRFWAFVDAMAPGMLLAQAIGRLGNWFNHELFGLPTTLPWGLEIPAGDPHLPAGVAPGTLFHPLFLYEIVWNLIGIGIILLLERRFRLQRGRAIGVYLVWYGLGRSWLEAIRIDPTSDAFLGVPANDWASFAAVAIGVVVLVVKGRRHRDPEPSPWLPGREPIVQDTTAAEVVAAQR